MKPDRLDHLIQALFDGLLDDDGREELNALLLGSKDARDRYRRANDFHATLLRRSSAVEHLGEGETIVMPVRGKWRRRIATVAAVAVIGAGCAFFIQKPESPRARLVTTVDSTWGGDIRLAANQKLPVSTPLELIRGVAELSYPSGAQVTLEGPCRFQLDKAEAITVLHGRASVHAPPGAQGFRVDTPGGRFVDLGTRFGLAVGSDGSQPVILTEVYEGEIEVQAVAGKPRLSQGDARALLQDADGSRLLSPSLDTDPVTVPKIISKPMATVETGVNLALGKPVTSPGHCIRPHGSVFPPGNLTDGRTNDSGVPGDWSFWLAPNGENGEFTVDLETSRRIGRISLQNTANRRIDDRGTENFQVHVSTDGIHFTPVIEGKLPRIDTRADGAFPFHDFTFGAVEARYVKIVVTSHYRHPDRPASDKNQGGGLNEIRVFSR
ncbi:discoidin domain-containing protein [Luteolibacter yonseiensis]|uniref:Discoidin domain-containing protein n=1 Tax=Luteolibacter yonseiensis TaxID=1144680 RepID=A0A934R431_9BACT|nr:discoidin domain-containing protein [Luteolibacter yonseiensis]MBK1816746.1 discoidin domain-containing protein [Luteolibacter yonseiensis]